MEWRGGEGRGDLEWERHVEGGVESVSIFILETYIIERRVSVSLQSQLSAVQSERDELAEANNNLMKTIADLEQEIQRWVGGYVIM